jgi:hypothetical protein
MKKLAEGCFGSQGFLRANIPIGYSINFLKLTRLVEVLTEVDFSFIERRP